MAQSAEFALVALVASGIATAMMTQLGTDLPAAFNAQARSAMEASMDRAMGVASSEPAKVVIAAQNVVLDPCDAKTSASLR